MINRLKIIRVILCLLFLSSHQSYAGEYVKVAENEAMIVYVDVGTIRKNNEIVEFTEVVNLKRENTNSSGQKFKSHKIEEWINCSSNEQKILYITVYEGASATGSVIDKGVSNSPIRKIPAEALSNSTMKFVCSK